MASISQTILGKIVAAKQEWVAARKESQPPGELPGRADPERSGLRGGSAQRLHLLHSGVQEGLPTPRA